MPFFQRIALIHAIALSLAIPAAAAKNYHLVAIHPRSGEVFTQGLEFHQGRLYESSGRYRRSFIYYGTVEGPQKRRALSDDLFAEGLTILDDRLYLLTWQQGKCLILDPRTLETIDEFAYRGEGWGMANNGRRLIMSDGSASLRFIDPESREIVRRLQVHYRGNPVDGLNELEWHDGLILANRWKHDHLLIIDETTGQVLQILDLSDLYPRTLRSPKARVMNGIAYDKDSDTWLITGKYWPAYFRLKLNLPSP